MAEYPKRPSHFAHRFCRLLTKSAAAQTIGPQACWLLTVIVHLEDTKRYSGAVTFFNEQLMPLCGFGSRDPLVSARTKAIEAGWLHYEEGKKGIPGRYWVLIPGEYDGLSDVMHDEEPRKMPSTNRTANQEKESRCRPDSGRHSDGNETETRRHSDGNASAFIPIPNPIPEEKPSCPESEIPDEPDPEPPKKRLCFESEDLATAEHILAGVQTVVPHLKPQNLEAWANEIRLMRQRDGPDRTHQGIRELFDWANRDPFWKANILSPAKLREKWDYLTAKRNANHRARHDRDNTGTELVKPGRGRL